MSNHVPEGLQDTAACEPFNWVVESRIQRQVTQAYEDARKDISERLAAIYSDHSNKGLVRSGITLRASIDAIEAQCRELISTLLPKVLQISRDRRALDLVRESIGQYLAFLDREVDAIARKVAFEIQEMKKARSLSQSAKVLWAERRAVLLEEFEQRRSDLFVLPKASPAADQAATAEPDDEPSGEAEACAQNCGDCRHWERLSEGWKDQPGLCRLFALAPSFNGWPITAAGDHCEEWVGTDSCQENERTRPHERRATARLRREPPALLRLPSGNWSVQVVNISEEGARLKATNPPPVGAPAFLNWDSYEFSCDVEWANDSSFGVKFAKPITREVIFEMTGQSADARSRVANPSRIPLASKRGRRQLVT